MNGFRFKKKCLYLCLYLAILVLNACKVGPEYISPNVRITNHYKEASFQNDEKLHWKKIQLTKRTDNDNWWYLFNDPLFNHFINQINTSNQSLQAAEAAWRKAYSLIQEKNAAQWPALSGGVKGQYETNLSDKQNNNQLKYETNLTANWEIDLWKKAKRQISIQSAETEFAKLKQEEIRLSLQTSLAQNYFNLRTFDTAYQLLNDALKRYQSMLTLTQNRYDRGIVSYADVLKAKINLHNAQARIADNRATRASFEHAIALLLGKVPAEFTLDKQDKLTEPPEIPLLFPSSLIERRADIVAAERKVAIANQKIGIEYTALFPVFNLTTTLASGPVNWLALPIKWWAFLPSATINLFDYQARRARIAAADSEYDKEVADYRELVLTAFQEVEDCLAKLKYFQNIQNEYQQSVDIAQKALTIQMNRYRVGVALPLEVFDAQNNLTEAENNLNTIRGKRWETTATLVKALGGGWINPL